MHVSKWMSLYDKDQKFLYMHFYCIPHNQGLNDNFYVMIRMKCVCWFFFYVTCTSTSKPYLLVDLRYLLSPSVTSVPIVISFNSEIFLHSIIHILNSFNSRWSVRRTLVIKYHKTAGSDFWAIKISGKKN